MLMVLSLFMCSSVTKLVNMIFWVQTAPLAAHLVHFKWLPTLRPSQTKLWCTS